jgi:hypothetical protein
MYPNNLFADNVSLMIGFFASKQWLRAVTQANRTRFSGNWGAISILLKKPFRFTGLGLT